MKALIKAFYYYSFMSLISLSSSFGTEEEVDPYKVYNYQLIRSEDQPSFQWAIKKGETYVQFLQLKPLPKKIDFSSAFSALKNQKELGSCTAQAITLSLEYILKKNGINEKLSPLYVYYNERKLTNSLDTDDGASLTDAIKAVKKYGICREKTWPYQEIQTQYKIKPTKEAYLEGKRIFKHMKLVHTHLPHDLTIIKSFLASKIPVLCGINMFISAESTKTLRTGVIPMPASYERPIGAHAIVLVGYNDKKQLFKFANSWGDKWGDNGFGYIPYKFIMNNNPDNKSIHTLPNELWCTNLKEG